MLNNRSLSKISRGWKNIRLRKIVWKRIGKGIVVQKGIYFTDLSREHQLFRLSHKSQLQNNL